MTENETEILRQFEEQFQAERGSHHFKQLEYTGNEPIEDPYLSSDYIVAVADNRYTAIGVDFTDISCQVDEHEIIQHDTGMEIVDLVELSNSNEEEPTYVAVQFIDKLSEVFGVSQEEIISNCQIAGDERFFPVLYVSPDVDLIALIAPWNVED